MGIAQLAFTPPPFPVNRVMCCTFFGPYFLAWQQVGWGTRKSLIEFQEWFLIICHPLTCIFSISTNTILTLKISIKMRRRIQLKVCYEVWVIHSFIIEADIWTSSQVNLFGFMILFDAHCVWRIALRLMIIDHPFCESSSLHACNWKY